MFSTVLGIAALLLPSAGALEVNFMKMEIYSGPNCDKGILNPSISDGSNILFYGNDHDVYVHVVNPSAGDLQAASAFHEYADTEDWEAASLCDNMIAIVEKKVVNWETEETEVWLKLYKAGSENVFKETELPEVPLQITLTGKCDGNRVIVLYKNRLSQLHIRDNGHFKTVCDVDLDNYFASPFSYDMSNGKTAAFVVGKARDSKSRRVVAVKIEDSKRCGEILWTSTLNQKTGNPRVIQVKTDKRDEVLLASNYFYARIKKGSDTSDPEVLKLVQEKSLFLPGVGNPAVLDYSEEADVIFSASVVDGKALLRASNAVTGTELFTTDFTKRLAELDPGDNREDYPPTCYNSVDPINCDGSTCAGFEFLNCTKPRRMKWSSKAVCCMTSGDCCVNDTNGHWQVNWWHWASDPAITGVHAIGDTVAVVGAYQGSVVDEGNYLYPFVVLFEVDKYHPFDNHVCRVGINDGGEEDKHYTKHTTTFAKCNEMCSANILCSGFEYTAEIKNCEIWTAFIPLVEKQDGHECYVKHVIQS